MMLARAGGGLHGPHLALAVSRATRLLSHAAAVGASIGISAAGRRRRAFGMHTDAGNVTIPQARLDELLVRCVGACMHMSGSARGVLVAASAGDGKR